MEHFRQAEEALLMQALQINPHLQPEHVGLRNNDNFSHLHGPRLWSWQQISRERCMGLLISLLIGSFLGSLFVWRRLGYR